MIAPAKEKGQLKVMEKSRQGLLWKRDENLYPFYSKTKKEAQVIPKHPEGLLQPSFCSVLSITPKSEENIWPIHCWHCKELGEMWNDSPAGEKQPQEKTAAKGKESYRKDFAAYELKESLMQKKTEKKRKRISQGWKKQEKGGRREK